MLAVILESGDPERLYTGLSLLVSAASGGRPARGLATFGALGALLDPDLATRAGAHVTAGEREPFGRTLGELRDAARELPDCRIWACAAAVQATGADWAAISERLEGVTSTPQFLREVEGAQTGGRMKWLWLLAPLLLAACGSPPADLFVVNRSGSDHNANLTMLVSDDGMVTCNGKQHPITSKELLEARALTRDLSQQAELHIQLPPGPNAVLSYRVRMQAGTVGFSDTSRPLPSTFTRLTVFTKDISEDVCGLRRE